MLNHTPPPATPSAAPQIAANLNGSLRAASGGGATRLMPQFATSIILAAALLCTTAAASDLIPPGTVLATRNAGGEEANTTPGSERNHVALVGPNGWVLEAQGPPPNKVIAVPFRAFFARYPDIQAYRLADDVVGIKWAAAAVEQLGKPYAKLRANCVTLLATSYPDGRQRWRRPDHVVAEGELLWIKKIADEDFTPPADPWAGMTTDTAVVRGGKP